MAHELVPQNTEVPYDVWCHVIDMLPTLDDLDWLPFSLSDTLRACALVRRDWLPRARKHLYKEIHLHRRSMYSALCRTLVESPELGTLIQELHWYMRRHPEPQPGIASTEDWGNVPLTPFAISRLTNLRVVAATSALMIPPPPSFLPFARSFGCCQTLRTIQFQDVVFPSMQEVLRTVWSLPAITTLVLISCRYPDHPGDTVNEDEYPDRCRNLSEVIVSLFYDTN